MRKWIKSAVLLFAVFLLMALVACSSDDSSGNSKGASGGNGDSSGDDSGGGETYDNGLPKDKKVTLKYAFPEVGLGREYVDYAIKTFTEKFPNVSFDVTYDPQPKKIINTKIAAGNDKDMFDMFGNPDGATLTSAAKEGKVVLLKDIWDHELYDTPGKTIKDVAMDGLYKSRPLTLGKSYAIPNVYSGFGLWFDKNLFEKHGWNQDPQTWDEFVDLLKNIKADSITPLTFPGVYANYAEDAFGIQKELELADENGHAKEYRENHRNYKTPYYTTPEKKEIWNRIYQLGKKGYFVSGLPALDHIQSQMQIIQHKAAMVSSGSWIAGEMKDSMPDDFEWGYMSVPVKSDADTPIHMRTTTGTGQSFYIWKEKPELHIKWAKEFAVWLWNMDVEEKLAEAGAVPGRTDFGDDPERAKKMDSANRALFEYMNSHNMTTGPTTALKSINSPFMSQASDNFKDNIPVIATGKKDPIPVLKKSEKLFEKALKDDKK